MRISERKGRSLMEVTYSNDGKHAYVDGLSFCRDDKTGYYRRSSFGGKPGIRLHCYVWEKHNGKIPSGCAIHHKDHDKGNNEVGNLECLTLSEHARLHGSEQDDDAREKKRRNIVEKARPAAIAWHKSDEGREWHRKHGAEAYAKRKPVRRVCEWCGKEYETKKLSNTRFCSGRCASAHRRSTGVDNETRRCSICDSEFVTNKYSKRKRCSKCRHVKA